MPNDEINTTDRYWEAIEATNERINEHHKAYEKTVTALRAEVRRLEAEIERLKAKDASE